MYPDEEAWDRIRLVAGDFRTYELPPGVAFGLIALSSFLHAYGWMEARQLLHRAVNLLKPDGLLLIHDYFPNRLGRSPHKGPLYDLNMMLNTFDGACHESSRVMEWIRDTGMSRIEVHDLSTDSSVVLATRQEANPAEKIDLEEWVYVALHTGFRNAALTRAENIVTAPWVRMKCKCGCASYGHNLQCPPHGMESHATKEMLRSYTWTLVLEGTPPGRDFHRSLLEMEKKAFLSGFPKAFVLGAGPCPVCQRCPEDGRCRHPDQARPSMEGSGIDVYSTVRRVGFRLSPVTEPDHYVKYFGLLLLE
jgi:predicted metal-binding protein